MSEPNGQSFGSVVLQRSGGRTVAASPRLQGVALRPGGAAHHHLRGLVPKAQSVRPGDDAAKSHRQAVSRLRRAILEDYSYRDLRQVDWHERFDSLGPALAASHSAEEFADRAAKLLNAAKDMHLWLRLNGRTFPTHRRCLPRNVRLLLLPEVVPGWRRHNPIVTSGKFPDGIAYLGLRAWPAAAPARLRPAYRILRLAAERSDRLILDIRANGGGSEPLAAQFAGSFTSRMVSYAKHRRRRGGHFGPLIERWLRPNRAAPAFRGRVAVLVGPGTVSSCESFALMMRQVAGCRLVGAPTAGASGNPQPKDLGNGLVVFVPSWQDLDLDGTCLEGRGVAPDIEVKASDCISGDPVLAAALKFLRGPAPAPAHSPSASAT